MTTPDDFLIAAHSALSFLEDAHAFSVTQTIAPPEAHSNLAFYKLTYCKQLPSKETLFVSLCTCPVRLELDLDLGRGWPPEHHNTTDARELLAIESPGAKLEFTYGVYAAFGDVQKMTEQYAKLANVLEQFGGRFFADEQSLWEDIRQFRESQTELLKYHEDSRSAELAFKQGDWKQAIELLAVLGNNQTNLQAARLAYAQKQIAK